jgi:DNA ligase-1
MFSIRYKTTSQQLLIASIALGLTTFPLYATSISTIPIPLAQTYVEAEHSLSTYLVSEKLDGIRAIWTGRELLTRNGNPIHAPTWFIAGLPNFALDGELWSHQRNFEAIQSIVLTQEPHDLEWQDIEYHVFDHPNTTLPFRDRYQFLQHWFSDNLAQNQRHLVLITQVEISEHVQLQQQLDTVIANGGEGLILRDPNTPSINGRQDTMLKLKPHEDAEAIVVGYRAGKGKYTGMTGALIVRDSNNLEFAIGSGLSDQLRRNPPEIGTVIMYRFQNLTQKGIPRFARYMRVRHQE